MENLNSRVKVSWGGLIWSFTVWNEIEINKHDLCLMGINLGVHGKYV